MIIFKIIKAAFSLLFFFLNPMTWIHWSKSKERLHNELSWIWLKYHCFVLHKLSYPKIIRRISEKRRRGETVHVAFIVLDTSKWNVDSVYREFNNLPGYDTTIIVFPYSPLQRGNDSNVEDSAEFFQKKGYRVEFGYDPKKNVYKSYTFWKDYDIVFFDTPWPQSAPVHPVLQIEVIGKYALTCYIPYGFMAINDPVLHYDQPNHAFAWKVFAETPWHKEQFQIHNIVMKGTNVESFGYPKLDTYSIEVSNPERVWKSGLNPNIHRIIWAPHWTINNNQFVRQYSFFHLVYKQMMEYANSHREIDWLFKPHPILYKTIISQNLMTVQQADEYYQQWAEMPNGQICLDGQFWDYFKTSDAIITDSIGFLVEYLPTKKPILRLASKENAVDGFNEQSNQINKDYYLGNSFEDIVSFIDDVVIRDNDYNYDKRMQALELLPNIGTAGRLMVQYINQQFEK